MKQHTSMSGGGGVPILLTTEECGRAEATGLIREEAASSPVPLPSPTLTDDGSVKGPGPGMGLGLGLGLGRSASLPGLPGGLGAQEYGALEEGVGGSSGGLRKRCRTVMTPHQSRMLRRVLEQTAFPSTEVRESLAKMLGMKPRTVQIWFQNQRQKSRQVVGSGAGTLTGEGGMKGPASGLTPSFSTLTVCELPRADQCSDRGAHGGHGGHGEHQYFNAQHAQHPHHPQHTHTQQPTSNRSLP